MRVAYKQTDGIAHDIRAVKHDYVLLPDEIESNVGRISQEALSDPAAWAARIAAEAAKEAQETADATELQATKSDNQVQAFLNRTQAQIGSFVDAQVADPGTRTLFKLTLRMLQAIGRATLRQ